jgi:hypothetical protein
MIRDGDDTLLLGLVHNVMIYHIISDDYYVIIYVSIENYGDLGIPRCKKPLIHGLLYVPQLGFLKRPPNHAKISLDHG